jgi:hypothetical protein
MTSIHTIREQQRLALKEIHETIKELDPKAASNLLRYTPGGTLPNSSKTLPEFHLYTLEALLILARAVKGKKRGRKPNVVIRDEESQAS